MKTKLIFLSALMIAPLYGQNLVTDGSFEFGTTNIEGVNNVTPKYDALGWNGFYYNSATDGHWATTYNGGRGLTWLIHNREFNWFTY